MPSLRYTLPTDPAERPTMKAYPGTALHQQGEELQLSLFCCLRLVDG
jgi:hypothetical protein